MEERISSTMPGDGELDWKGRNWSRHRRKKRCRDNRQRRNASQRGRLRLWSQRYFERAARNARVRSGVLFAGRRCGAACGVVTGCFGDFHAMRVALAGRIVFARRYLRSCFGRGENQQGAAVETCEGGHPKRNGNGRGDLRDWERRAHPTRIIGVFSSPPVRKNTSIAVSLDGSTGRASHGPYRC